MVNHPVEVKIGRRLYRRRGDDPAALARLAARVDATLQEIAGPSGDPEDYKVAVLAALNLAASAEEGAREAGSRGEQVQQVIAELEQRLTALRERLTAAEGAV